MPIYQGYGPFPITIGGRQFTYCFTEDGPSFGSFDVDSVDGVLSIQARRETLAVWGSVFPGTSRKRPKNLEYLPQGLTVRSPDDAVRAVVEWCLMLAGSTT